MRKFIFRGLLYALPLIFIIVLIATIDPYNLFHKGRAFDQEKFDIGYSFDQGRRFKIFSFFHNPTDKIILGASEINLIHERNIPEKRWHSLSFGGAKLEESIDLFWYVAKRYPLRKVLIAPEFIKFQVAVNDEAIDYYNWNQSQSKKAIDIYGSPLDAFLDKYNIQSTYYSILSVFGIENSRSKPSMSKEAFWKSQLNYCVEKNYKMPDSVKVEKMYGEFRRIKAFCNSNSIEVMIVLPIQHTDIIRVEYSDKVYPLYRDYLSHLIEIFGIVFFYDFPNEISKDPKMFSDPFHCIDSDVYLKSLWGNETKTMLKLESHKDLNLVDSIRENYLNIQK